MPKQFLSHKYFNLIERNKYHPYSNRKINRVGIHNERKPTWQLFASHEAVHVIAFMHETNAIYDIFLSIYF